MEQATKNTLLNITFTTILVLALFTYQYITTDRIKTDIASNITRIDKSVIDTKQELTGQITGLRTYVDTENERLGEEIKGRVNYVENKLNITRKEQQQKIKEVTGKIEQVQLESTQKFTEFEEQIKNIKVKSKDFSGIIQDILKSVVTIRTDKSMGSGVIIDTKGYIVTNYHVLDGATQAGLRMYDNKMFSIKIVGAEKNSDIAIIKIDPAEQNAVLFALEFETSRINTGDKVIAVGNPAGLEFSVTEGIISSNERTGPNGVKYVQTDVPINPGNSGGPLVNIKSKIVGINTMKKENMEGLGFAVHAEVVKQISEQIIQQYETQQQ